MFQAIKGGDLALIKVIHLSTPHPFTLSTPDPLGNTPAYTAVLYDRPEVLEFLHLNKVDLSCMKTTDSSSFANAIFYATYYSKTQILSALWKMGYDLSQPCCKFGLTPLFYSRQNNDIYTTKHLEELIQGGTLQDVMVLIVQRVGRGYMGRCEVKRKVVLMERMNYAGSMIGKVWRGGVVRMREFRRGKEVEEEEGKKSLEVGEKEKGVGE